MTEPDSRTEQDPAWQPLYAAGAVSAGLAVVAYAVALVVVAVSTSPPDAGGASVLTYVHIHRSLYIVRQVLWMMPSLFLIVVSLALAVALRHVSKSWAAIVGVIAITSWAVSFAWPTSGDGSLIMVVLSDRYVDASTESARAASVAGAELLVAFNSVPAVIGVLQTLGVLLISLLMLRSSFSTVVAWLGVVTGAIGIVSELLRPLLGWAYAIYGLLLFVWLAWIALALWKLAVRQRRHVAEEVSSPI
ncbi:MAG TPA: hypothetical protein VIP98_10060 [Microlunatus sp.]